MSRPDVLIVGAGLAGLGCALELHSQGVRPLLLEASDGVGGRVRTDEHEGFLLDRGFQVLLEAYPECRRILDYDDLDLRPFFPGADIWTGKEFARFVDPFRRPRDAFATLRASVGTFPDKLRVTGLREEVRAGRARDVLVGPDVTALQDLEAKGFTSGMIDAFFRPFFGGILLDRTLSDSARIFRYLFRMFSEGDTSVPAKGMGRIPAQLARRLPEGSVRLGTRVDQVAPGKVRLDDGEEMAAEAVVVAVEGPEAARFLEGVPAPASKAVTCLYFASSRSPLDDPILVLNGEGTGPVNNLAVMSRVSPAYAPEGQELISVTCLGSPVVGDGDLEQEVRTQVEGWFGKEVEEWRHLRTYRIPHAQPGQAPGVLDPPERSVRVQDGLFVCGDHRETASLQGALHSGRRAAREVLRQGEEGA